MNLYIGRSTIMLNICRFNIAPTNNLFYSSVKNFNIGISAVR